MNRASLGFSWHRNKARERCFITSLLATPRRSAVRSANLRTRNYNPRTQLDVTAHQSAVTKCLHVGVLGQWLFFWKPEEIYINEITMWSVDSRSDYSATSADLEVGRSLLIAEIVSTPQVSVFSGVSPRSCIVLTNRRKTCTSVVFALFPNRSLRALDSALF